MLRNFFLVTIRNLFKNSVYTFINIAGLAIGITCTILILLWVFDELTYDRFLPKANRLYQVWVNAEYDGQINSWNSVPCPTGEAMKSADSNIINSAMCDWGGEHLFSTGEKRIFKRAHFVGDAFLEMFEFPLRYGNAADVLDDPSSVVITSSMATALFGNEDPINKSIRMDDRTDLKVTGVLHDLPKNSSLEFDALVTWSMNEQLNPWVKESRENWGNYSFQTFIEINNAENETIVEDAIRPMLANHGETDFKPEFFLHPMTRWRLYSQFENGRENGGMIEYVQMFSAIAVFILVIACINFMNLATARSERRAKEVGIRKSVGSRRHELILQFLGESFFISFASFVVAMLATVLILPYYNDLVEKQLTIDYTSQEFWIFAISLIGITGFVAGSYPAFYLSSFQPIKVLKGKILAGRSASLPRKILVTLQFGFSILLIIGTLVIYEQIQLVKSRQLGYDQENLITVDYTTEVGKHYPSIKQELLRTGVVESVTKSNSPITEIQSNNFLGWPGKPEDQRVLFTTVATEYDYTKTMGIGILEGRDFSEDFKSDTAAIIVNKAAMEIMQLKDPIGTELDLWGGKRTLIGIVDNVLMGSPFQAVKPMMVVLQPDWAGSVTIRLKKTTDLQASLKEVEGVFNRFNPAYPFEYAFADVEFQKKFKNINMNAQLANLFALLAILITGLGLFGLAAYTAEQRTKEIGIRKVLGASVSSLVTLMSGDFSRLVILSFILSAPLAWWLLDLYLERYPVRIDIPWWVFPVTGGISLTFALVIVATQALRAAQANPVTSLRNE